MNKSIVAYGKGVYGYHATAKMEFMAGMYSTELMAIQFNHNWPTQMWQMGRVLWFSVCFGCFNLPGIARG